MTETGTVERALLWTREDQPGAEWCAARIGSDRLEACGVQLGAVPVPYRLDYRVTTGAGFVTSEVDVHVRGGDWSRRLLLRRHEDGQWSVDVSATGDTSLQPPGGDANLLHGAYDCDLGCSPLFNTLPVRRLRLLERPGEQERLLAAWIRVPDLVVEPLPQRYSAHEAGRVAYESGTFAAELSLDPDGIVVRYPGLAQLA
jgi:hypothetical protein